jgi:hypothetical protein
MKTVESKQIEDGIEYRIVENAFTRNWFLNGKRHRLKGPAVEWLLDEGDEGIHNTWYYNGEVIPCKSQEEFERILKLKAFL